MNASRPIGAVLAALLLAAASGAQEPTPGASAEPRKITVTAKKYEFNPARIELKAGEETQITFQSEDTKHGFALKELGVEKVVFEKDKPQTVTIKAEKPGTYPFKCANFCGFGHGKMKGEIVVTAADSKPAEGSPNHNR